MPKRFEHCFLDWTSIPYEIGFAIINWIYTNDTPVRLRNDNLSEKDTNENDSFVLTLMKSAKSFGLQDLMNRCEESLVARVQVIEALKSKHYLVKELNKYIYTQFWYFFECYHYFP